MARAIYRLATVVLLTLVSASGCASWTGERHSVAGHLSDGSTGGGWSTIDTMTAPP